MFHAKIIKTILSLRSSVKDNQIKEYDVYNIYSYMYKVVGILINQSTYRISVAELQDSEEW